MAKTNANAYMERHFPELRKYKRSVSRMWERKYDRRYLDDWWFKLGVDDLSETEFFIFVGAKDYSDMDFKLFKVPSSYLAENLKGLSVTDKGWINIYVHIRTFKDIRGQVELSFGEFALN
jgi:hypothetical protein